MQKRKAVTILTVALVVVLGSAMALADNLSLGGSSNQLTVTGGTGGVAGTWGGGSIGPSTLNGDPLAWVYCVDIPDHVYIPGDYPNASFNNNGTIAGSSANNTALGITGYTTDGQQAAVTNAMAVAYLLHTYATGAISNAAQAALQGAIWSVIYGVTMTGGPSGSLAIYSADMNQVTAACGNNFNSCTNDYVGDFDWLSPSGSSSSVDQGLITNKVPDGGMTLMLLGGTLVGVATLRRKFRV